LLPAFGCKSSGSRAQPRHRGRDGRGSIIKEASHGHERQFHKSGDRYTGAVRTLTLNVKAQIAPAEEENDKVPDYRVFAGQIELGAAWKKTSNTGPEYLSVKLDDPSLPAPIYASPVEAEGADEFTLLWSRDRRNDQA